MGWHVSRIRWDNTEKYCYLWDKQESEGENLFTEPNTCNVCGLMDTCVHETCRVWSGPDGEGEDCPWRPNTNIKQRSVYDGHHKCHGISCLSVSYPNGMSTVVGLASARNWDGNMLQWSDLDKQLCNLCTSHGLTPYSFHADRGFSGLWLCMRTPHRATFPCQLTARSHHVKNSCEGDMGTCHD